MAKMRLTAETRARLAHHIVALTFKERTEELIAEEQALFTLCAENIYGKEDLAAIAALPEHWFKSIGHVYVHAYGYGAHFDSRNYIRVPFRTISGDARIQDSPALTTRVHAYLQAREKTQETKDTLRRTLDGLLRICTTLEKFYAAMPEAEAMVGDLLGKPEPKATALVVTGQQVMCIIAKAKGEEREGCCDGVIAA